MRVRLQVFSQSLQVVTQGTLNTLSLIKDIGSTLLRLKQVPSTLPKYKYLQQKCILCGIVVQFLLDRAALERDYSSKLEALGRRCSQGSSDSSSSGSTAASEFFHTTMTAADLVSGWVSGWKGS